MSSLRHVRWLGGGSGAAKSSVARELSARYQVEVYDTDAAMQDHARRLSPTEAPLLQRFLEMSMDERWALRSPREMLETFHWFAGEGFGLIVDDLRERAGDRVVVVEGFRLLPRLVRPLVERPSDALWLLPTPQFRQRAFDDRGSTMTIAGRTSDPPRALANLMARDAMFTEELRQQLAPEEVEVVDGARSLSRLVEDVARRWRLGVLGADH